MKTKKTKPNYRGMLLVEAMILFAMCIHLGINFYSSMTSPLYSSLTMYVNVLIAVPYIFVMLVIFFINILMVKEYAKSYVK